MNASAWQASTSTSLRAAFSRVASTAASSTSIAWIGAKPSFAAAIESTPEPQPTSSSEPRSDSWSSSSVRRVVGCAPVPNARPGSMTTVSPTPGGKPGTASGSSQGGPTQRPPTRTPWWKSRQRSGQSSATSSDSTTSKPSGGSSA